MSPRPRVSTAGECLGCSPMLPSPLKLAARVQMACCHAVAAAPPAGKRGGRRGSHKDSMAVPGGMHSLYGAPGDSGAWLGCVQVASGGGLVAAVAAGASRAVSPLPPAPLPAAGGLSAEEAEALQQQNAALQEALDAARQQAADAFQQARGAR